MDGFHRVAAFVAVLLAFAGTANAQDETARKAERSVGPRASLTYPTGSRADSIFHVEQQAPDEIRLDEPAELGGKVTNLTKTKIEGVRVELEVPGHFDVRNAQPSAEVTGKRVRWSLGSFAPGETRELTARGIPTQLGGLRTCVTVHYKPPRFCLETTVVTPELELEMEAPDSVLKCETIPVRYTITNTGGGTAHGVGLRNQLPQGVRADGEDPSVFSREVGSLAPGESRTFRTELSPQRVGKVTHEAVASGDGDLETTASVTTAIRKPSLDIAVSGMDRMWWGRAASYEITVANTGDGAARNTVVADQLPEAAEILHVSDNGRTRDDDQKKGGKRLIWDLGTLAPGASKTLTAKVRPIEKGVIRNRVSASAFCAEDVSDAIETKVEGVPAMLLEVIDVADPVEVGEDTTYVITATNQGTAVGTNVAITCKLEKEMELLSARGPTASSVSEDRSEITFAPADRVEPGEAIEWTVRVKAKESAGVRFKVEMTSDQLGERPVLETEATNFYE